jgi:hypothetical protein
LSLCSEAARPFVVFDVEFATTEATVVALDIDDTPDEPDPRFEPGNPTDVGLEYVALPVAVIMEDSTADTPPVVTPTEGGLGPLLPP